MKNVSWNKSKHQTSNTSTLNPEALLSCRAGPEKQVWPKRKQRLLRAVCGHRGLEDLCGCQTIVLVSLFGRFTINQQLCRLNEHLFLWSQKSSLVRSYAAKRTISWTLLLFPFSNEMWEALFKKLDRKVCISQCGAFIANSDHRNVLFYDVNQFKCTRRLHSPHQITIHLERCPSYSIYQLHYITFVKIGFIAHLLDYHTYMQHTLSW